MKVTIKRGKKSAYQIVHRRITGARTLLKLASSHLKAGRQIALDEARLRQFDRDHEIAELILAEKSDKLVLLDLEIEKKKLELLALQRKLGGGADQFADPMTED